MTGHGNQFDFDFIVIGSGFGGSVSALRLAEKGYRVAVMEMGRRWTPDNLPHASCLVWLPSVSLQRGHHDHGLSQSPYLQRLQSVLE